MDSYKIALKSLLKKPTRTILTVCSIAIGVAAVLIISLVSDAGTVLINRELDSLGIHGITISISQNGQDIYLDEKDLDYIKQLENVEDALPILTENGYIYDNAKQNATIFWGISGSAQQIISLEAEYGRLISDVDVLSKENVCVIDKNTAKAYFHHENCVGNKIMLSVNGLCEYYTVIGVASPNSSILESISSELIPTIIYVPYTNLQSKTGSLSVGKIAIRLNETDGSTLETDIARIEKEISLKKSTDAVKTDNLASQRDKLTSILSTVTVMLSIIGSISLVVAGIGVMTLMLVSVGERKKEIGIKKAIGANRTTILGEFLIEALLLSAIGSLTGLLFTGIAAGVASGILGYTFEIRAQQWFLTIGVALCSGIVFGVYPANKASKLRPVDTLKSE